VAAFDLRDPELRERLAEEAYYRDRGDEVARDLEHLSDSDYSYWALSWDSLSDETRRPYRTTVTHVCEAMERALEA
jgi:hypothetical protein